MPALAFRTTLPKPDDPDILAKITEATLKGHLLSTASTLAGIGHSTAKEWRLQGEADLDAGEPSPHATFAATLKDAEAECVDGKLGHINEAGEKGYWQASGWYLERSRGQEWGKNDRVDITSTQLTIQVTLPPGAVPALSRTLDNARLLAPVDAEAEVQELDHSPDA